MDLLRPDEWLGRLTLPPLTELSSHLLTSDDVLVTCAGFEDRAFEFLRRAVGEGGKGFCLVGIDYLPEVGANRKAELEALVRGRTSSETWLTYDRQNPGDAGKDVLATCPSSRRLLVDVSGMSRLLMVQIVGAIIRAGRASTTTILYTEAAHYPPTKEAVEAAFSKADQLFGVINFISSGLFGLIAPAELSTVAMYGQPIRLIAFPTFNPTQFAALCSEINSSFFTVVHGVPPLPENAWRADAIRRLNNIDSLRHPEEFRTSTLDYRETVKLLVELYQRHGDRQKLVIAPTGSKMQSLAVGIFVGIAHDVQVVYPAPRLFLEPDNYTKGVRALYALNLGFLSP